MKEYNIRTSPVAFLDILELRVDEEINQHGTLIISGYISDEDEEKYLGILTDDVWEKVQLLSKDGNIETMFIGIVTDFAITYINDQKRLTLEVMTGSCLLDGAKHLRSFQNPSMTYEDIFKQITAEYAKADVDFVKSYAEAAGELILQYYETDWAFLKRLASRKHQFLIPDSKVQGIRFSYALPELKNFSLPEGGKYTVRKDLSKHREKVYAGMTAAEADSLEYMVECRETHRIGDYTVFHGEKFVVYKIQSRYAGGELLHDCYMKKAKGLEMPEIFHKEMAGCALSARVTKVKEDKVQVAILYDENDRQNINVWYPYATVYSTPDGTGWYCMPEPGDVVRLTVPQKQEKDAFVVSSVHMETDSPDRKNPEHKVFKSKYQKEVRFTPDSILITNNQGTKIALTDAEGIQIVSAHSVMLEAAEDLTITSDEGSLLVAGNSFVNFKQKGTSIQLDNGISFVGGNLKIQ